RTSFLTVSCSAGVKAGISAGHSPNRGWLTSTSDAGSSVSSILPPHQAIRPLHRHHESPPGSLRPEGARPCGCAPPTWDGVLVVRHFAQRGREAVRDLGARPAVGLGGRRRGS